MKKINLELKIEEEQILEEIRNLGQGYPVDNSFLVSKQINIFASLLKRSRKDLKDVFSNEELYFLFDAFNGAMYTPNIKAKDFISYGVSDSMALDYLDKKWGVKSGSFIQKINNLTEFQSLVLITVINKFWNNPRSYKDGNFAELFN